MSTPNLTSPERRRVTNILSSISRDVAALQEAVGTSSDNVAVSTTPRLSLRERLQASLANIPRRNVPQAHLSTERDRSLLRRKKVTQFTINKVILLRDNTEDPEPPTKDKALFRQMYRQKMVLEYVKFFKEDNEIDIMDKLRGEFRALGYPHLTEDVSLEFLKSDGSDSLVAPNRRPGPFTGEDLYNHFYRKILFLKPNRALPFNSTENNLSNSVSNPGNSSPDLRNQMNNEEDSITVSVPNSVSTSGSNIPDIENCMHNTEDAITLKEVVRGLNSQITEELSCTYWTIDRGEILASAFRKMSRKAFKPEKRLSITFTETLGKEEDLDRQVLTEEGSDLGGLAREFFTLCLREIHNSCPIFGGPEGEKNLIYHAPSNHKTETSETHYFYVGQLIAMSIVQGGPGPQFFSRSLYNAIVCGEVKNPQLEDIACETVRNRLISLQQARNVEEAQEILLCEEFTHAGLQTFINRMDEIHSIIEQAVYYYAVVQVESPLKELCRGLEVYGLLPAVRNCPHIFETVFCKNPNPPTKDDVKKLFKVIRSEDGSNHFRKEGLVLDWFWDLLDEYEEGLDEVTIEEFLFFATGCNHIPPLGFTSQPFLKFCFDDFRCFPTANTCIVTVYLPTKHARYEDFKHFVSFGIKNCKGFGLV